MAKKIFLFISLIIILGSACLQFYISFEGIANFVSLLSKVVFLFSLIYYTSFCFKYKHKIFNLFDLFVISFYVFLMYSSIRNSGDYVFVFPSLMKVLTIKFLMEPSIFKGQLKYIYGLIASSFYLLIALNFLQMIIAPGIMGYIDEDEAFLISSNYNQFGGIFVPAILAAILYDTYNSNRLFSITLILLCFISVLIPGSVTSCVTIFVLGVSYIFFKGYRKLKFTNYAILFSTMIFFFIYVIPVLGVDINDVINTITDKLDKDMTFNGRVFIWLNSLVMIAENPIWGYGLYDRDWGAMNLAGANAHNIILNLLLQGGIVLIGISLLLIIKVGINMVRLKSNRKIYYTIMLTSGSLLLMSQFEVYNYVFIMIFLYLIWFFPNSRCVQTWNG